MRQLTGLTLLISLLLGLRGPATGAPGDHARRVKFATGETVIDSNGDTDHVVIKDAHGKITADSWCDAGTFDAYLALFTKLKDSVARGDRTGVVRLAAFPLRVNARKRSIFRSEASLAKAYDKVFTPQVREMIRRAEPAAVFCRDGQGMLGDGVVWAGVSGGTAKIEVVNQ